MMKAGFPVPPTRSISSRADLRSQGLKGLLRVGVAWDVIEAAIGLTEAGFQELMAQPADPGL